MAASSIVGGVLSEYGTLVERALERVKRARSSAMIGARPVARLAAFALIGASPFLVGCLHRTPVPGPPAGCGGLVIDDPSRAGIVLKLSQVTANICDRPRMVSFSSAHR